MSAIIAAVGSVFTAAVGWVGDVAGLIAGTSTVEGVTTFDNPILLIFCVLPLIGLGVGFFKRLIKAN